MEHQALVSIIRSRRRNYLSISRYKTARSVLNSPASIEDVEFDDAATLAIGQAFDKACKLLRRTRRAFPA
jgi:hypothetical protein